MEKSQIRHIRSLMESLGFTKATLAEKCGLSAMTIHRILTDEAYNPTQKTIQAIADALEVDEQDILQCSGETATKVKINGYIDYLGQITRIETVNQQVRDIKVKERENKKSQDKTLDISSIDLFRHEEYDTSIVCTHSFRSNGDIVNDKPNDLGNMASRYGFDLLNEYFHNSECQVEQEGTSREC